MNEIFAMIRDSELRPFKQMIELQGLSLECKYVSNYTPLMEAAYLQRLDFVKYICEQIKKKYGAHSMEYKRYLNQTSSDGKTALVIATLSNDSKEVIEYLLSQDASVDIEDLQGKTLKYYVPYASSEDVEKFLGTYLLGIH